VLKLNERELRDRRKDVIRLITPLVDRNRVEVRPLVGGQTYTLGLLSKGQDPAAVDSPSLVRVPTRSAGVFINYYEVWRLERETNDYLLDRAYMHLHLKRTERAPDIQLLCLHCDPLVAANDESFRYKKGPHLHVLGATPNIDRAHISLCLNDPNHGGGDVDTLTASLELAVKMIQREIFPRYHY
jgi:hypothetical protein